MFKLKRIVPLLLMIAMLVLIAVPASAGPPTSARRGLSTSDAIETSTALALPAGTWVYGVTLFADDASSFAGLYDTATLEAANATNMKDELGEATQYDSKTKFGPPYPLYFKDGVTVIMATGVLTISFGGSPQN